MKKYYFLSAFIALLLVVFYSCSDLYHEGNSSVRTKDKIYKYDDVSVSASALTLYANLGGPATRSSADDGELVTLESLLDRSKTTSKSFSQYHLNEIPFIANASPSKALLSDAVPNQATDGYMSNVNMFLIETTDIDADTVDCKVVTMIPDQDYVSDYPDGAVSFINKDLFSGVILFSDLDGTFRDVYVYRGGSCPILNAEVIESSAEGDYSGSVYLSLLSFVETKSSDGATAPGDGSVLLEGSICIAYLEKTQERDYTWINPDSIDWEDDGLVDGLNTPGGGGGGGGGSVDSSADSLYWPPSYITILPGFNIGANPGQSYPITDKNPGTGHEIVFNPPVREEVQKYSVSLFSSAGGNVWGSGEYQVGSSVPCYAIADSSYVFDRWVGDFRGMGASVVLHVTEDVSATAYFHHLLAAGPYRPCYDAERGVYNPLKEMILAPTGKKVTNYIGSTFGMTRHGGTKSHQGLDLYAEPGTPVYAMYDGEIARNHSYVVEQPNRNDKGAYPPGYSGDENGAGNRFSIVSQLDGNDVYFLYWHLLEGNPVAKNPRTGLPFKPGDKVYAGEIVGYTGITGNAYNIPYPHLHLGVIRDYKYVNPEEYINGRVHWNSSCSVVKSVEIVNIKCQE